MFVQCALIQQNGGSPEGLGCVWQQQAQVLMEQHYAAVILHRNKTNKKIRSLNTHYAVCLQFCVLEQELSSLTKRAHTTEYCFLKLQSITTATGSLREASYGAGFNTKCVVVVPQCLCGCSSEPAGVCEGLTAGGGSVMEPPSVSGTDWTAVYHCSSPVHQMHAPVCTNNIQKGNRVNGKENICVLIAKSFLKIYWT